ncbi:MAG: tRNA uracil 4-sulfurtransferase ThiI [Pseudohongiellaceae bacterium]
MKYIVKYSTEITIKSRPVRNRFSRQLGKNLRLLLAKITDTAQVLVRWDHIELDIDAGHGTQAGQAEEVLGNTPGICTWLRVGKYPLLDFQDVLGHALDIYRDRLQDRTFAVRCKRAGQHAFTSMDVERFVGAGLMQQTGARGVNLGDPQVLVALEIRGDELFVIEDSGKGQGGFPTGSQDGVLSLLSGGFDSAVSSYLAIRRGLKTHFLFFNLGGREHEIAVKEVALYLWMKYGAARRVNFITVPFEGVVAEILNQVDNSQMGVVFKRMMLRAASEIAKDMHLEALVTGESVAQVSSQTLANLALIDRVSETMVLRPLIMSDKQEIVDLARQIGTEDFSAAIPEYCGVISVKPTTRARAHRIEKEEARFDFRVLDKAVASRRVWAIEQLGRAGVARQGPVSVAQPDAKAVILDIRHPDEEELKPLMVTGTPVQKVPFYQLNSVFGTLDSGVQYLLYCDKGIMSTLHASYLLDQGHTNVAVYRP